MQVKDFVKIAKSHSVEWAAATWNAKEFSIRNRFDKDDGGFNLAASSELPWHDFNFMVLESIKRKHFSRKELSEMLKMIGNYLENE